MWGWKVLTALCCFSLKLSFFPNLTIRAFEERCLTELLSHCQHNIVLKKESVAQRSGNIPTLSSNTLWLHLPPWKSGAGCHFGSAHLSGTGFLRGTWSWAVTGDDQGAGVLGPDLMRKREYNCRQGDRTEWRHTWPLCRMSQGPFPAPPVQGFLHSRGQRFLCCSVCYETTSQNSTPVCFRASPIDISGIYIFQ